MFSGIVRGIGKVVKIEPLSGLSRYSINTAPKFLASIEIGASIAIDGVCLTVTNFTSNEATFDVIHETLLRTNLKDLKEGSLVNIERAARFGDDIGGHILSGHVFDTAIIQSINQTENNCIFFFKCPIIWMKYLFPKGYIALNGASLTLVDVNRDQGIFSVHLIPETLEKTTFRTKNPGDRINMEIDSQTQAIVDTIEAFYKQKTF